jgi:hypothetical protein
MRYVTLAVFFILASGGFAGGLAFGAPFEPATIPDQVQAVGHLDVDALRKTQLFTEAGGQAAIDAALDDAPAKLRPIIHTLSRSVRGVSFWRDTEHGAVYVETRDARTVSQLLTKLPTKPARAIDGIPSYTIEHGDHDGFAAGYGDTLVLADTAESLEHSIRVLSGKEHSLAGSNKLPLSTRQGVFMFVTIDNNLLGAIQKSAHSKMLQLALRSLIVDVGESAGVVTASARAEMRSADALQKATSILDGLRALASLSSDAKTKALIDGLTVSSHGLTLEVAAKLPVAELVRMIQSAK